MRGRDDDDPDNEDNGEAAIAAFLEARLDPADYQKVMQMLAEGGSEEPVELEYGDRRRAKDRIPRVGATDSRGISRGALDSFQSRFPGAVR